MRTIDLKNEEVSSSDALRRVVREELKTAG